MLAISPETLSTHLPPRPRDCHKDDFGAVGVLGGAPGMAGAALLAGRAALACGTGRVYVGLLDERIGVDAVAPELMICSPERLQALPAPACLVAGPGLGSSAVARQWLQAALAVGHALLLDADALNLVARDASLLDSLRARAAPTLITPHAGEAARLLGESSDAIQADREGAVHRLLELTGATTVLKGAGTLVSRPDGPVWRNVSGNPGMAAPGMGDVLNGIIAALLVQGMTPEQAAIAGVWLHGAAADAAVQAGHGPVGLAAAEVIAFARTVLNEKLVTDH
jgi:ADP-dependent NAD(P)H-hydrate dehydratase / NAD(P)H-hydrate epimerase